MGVGACVAVLWVVLGEGGVGFRQICVMRRALRIPPSLPRTSFVGGKATAQLYVGEWL